MTAHQRRHTGIVIIPIRAHIAVRQNHRTAKPRGRLWKRFCKFAEDHECQIGRAIRETIDLAVENIDFAAGEILAQVIEGPAMAEAQFENRSGFCGDFGKGQGKAGMLGLEPEEKPFEP